MVAGSLSRAFRKGAVAAVAAMVLVGCTGPLSSSVTARPSSAEADTTTTTAIRTAEKTTGLATSLSTVTVPNVPSSVPPPAAHNYSTASAEAKRLLGLAVMPPSAVPAAKHATVAVTGPAVGGLASSSALDLPTFWTVPMSMAQAATWVPSHPPAGLLLSGRYPATAGAAARPVIGYGFTESDSIAWTNAGLDITIAAIDAHHSLWRVEGTASWLNPRPLLDDQPGARLRVTVAGPCPSSDRDIVGVSNVATDLEDKLLPSAPPVAALICRYAGAHGAAYHLAEHHLVAPAAARRLADLAGRVQLAYDSGGLIQSCAAGDDTRAIIAFAYPGRADVDLWLDLAFCPTVSNGRIRAWTAAMPLSSAGITALETAVLAAR